MFEWVLFVVVAVYVTVVSVFVIFFFFSSRRRHTRCLSDWSSDVCSSDLILERHHEDSPAFLRVGILGRELIRDHLQLGFGLPEGNAGFQTTKHVDVMRAPRSEERRVGKECRSRWSA